jgi:Dolichyl-phosphate-mannose-protein mannosyltransferase
MTSEPAGRPLAVTAPLRVERAVPATLAAIAAPLAVAIAFVVLAALTWSSWGDLSHDTGYDFVAADRLASGELPYSDFPYIYGPLGVSLLAGAFSVFGTSVGAAVALGLVLAAAAVALTYLLARELTGPLGAALAAVLAMSAALGTGNIGLVLPHATSASAAVVVGLLMLLAAARHARGAGRAWLPTAGVAAGALTLTRPEFALAGFAALGAWMGLRAWRLSGGDRRSALREAGVCFGAALAVPVIVYGLVLTQVGPGELRDNLFPSAQLAAGGNAVLEQSAPMTVGSFAELVARLLAYGAGAAALVGAGLYARRSPRARTAILAIAGAVALALALALVANPEAVRSRLEPAFAWIPAGAALATALLAWRSRRHDWAVSDQIALMLAAFLAVLAGKTYAAFAPHPSPDFAQFATYALPFAAVFLAWLHLEVLPRMGGETTRTLGALWLALLALCATGLLAHDGAAESQTVRGPGGSIAATPEEASAYQGALDAIDRLTRPGDPVLLAPQLTALYTLADRTNPLPQVSLLPGALATPADEDAAIARLRDVRVAVIDTRALTEYGQGAFGVTFAQRLGAYLRGEFRRVTTFGRAEGGAVSLELWQRSAS